MSISVSSLLARNNGRVRLCETHDRESTEIIRSTIGADGQVFDGIWYGGLCQTTDLGIPDTELVSPLQRAVLLSSNTNLQKGRSSHTLCAAFDADSGGAPSDIPALVGVLALKGVSMIIIEDKALNAPGQKVNSLLASSGTQLQADPQEFAQIIRAFKKAVGGKDMLVTARIESFTTRITQSDAAAEQASREASHKDALNRAAIYCEAGVDSIMIHSKSKRPDEVLAFCREFRRREPGKPLVVVPTTYSTTAREELHAAGANVVIYANHILRAKMSAVGGIMEKVLVERPDLFCSDAELTACLEAKNYGCMLRKLWERMYDGEETRDMQTYRILAATFAGDNMKAAVRELVEGELSGCEADGRIVSVKDLLKVNACQVSAVDELFG